MSSPVGMCYSVNIQDEDITSSILQKDGLSRFFACWCDNRCNRVTILYNLMEEFA